MKNDSDIFFITGTDTGVGKTVLALLMMQFFYKKKYSPFYLKPIQTGCKDPYDKESDARFIYQNVRALKSKDPADSVIYCFRNPKAPYFAAQDEGKENDIDIKLIQEVVNEKVNSFSPVILEGAGGLFVPVNRYMLMIDIIERTKARPVIASRSGLGTINHTLLTLEALKARKMEPAGIVFLDSGEIPTAEDTISENMEAVEKVSGVQVAGVIKKIQDFSNPERECYQPLERIFGK